LASNKTAQRVDGCRSAVRSIAKRSNAEKACRATFRHENNHGKDQRSYGEGSQSRRRQKEPAYNPVRETHVPRNQEELSRQNCPVGKLKRRWPARVCACAEVVRQQGVSTPVAQQTATRKYGNVVKPQRNTKGSQQQINGRRLQQLLPYAAVKPSRPARS